jgi:hypothetical protein
LTEAAPLLQTSRGLLRCDRPTDRITLFELRILTRDRVSLHAVSLASLRPNKLVSQPNPPSHAPLILIGFVDHIISNCDTRQLRSSFRGAFWLLSRSVDCEICRPS